MKNADLYFQPVGLSAPLFVVDVMLDLASGHVDIHVGYIVSLDELLSIITNNNGQFPGFTGGLADTKFVWNGMRTEREYQTVPP